MKYQEQDVRKDFIDKFWIALGWGVNHEAQKNPNEQEVKVERTVGVEGRAKKADYAFLAPNFRDVRFFVEAKKPARDIDNADDYFQTIRYGWNAQAPVSVLTDFEQFCVLDCRLKPDVRTALDRVVKKFHYADFEDEEKFAEIYYLFSREAAHAGALEKFAAGLPKPTGRGVNRRLSGEAFKTVDEDFLRELDELREELARSFKNRNPELDGEALTEATQRTLDRLVFMRFLEDKLIEPEVIVQKLGDGGSAWADFVAQSERLNRIYNGIIFKSHFIDAADFRADERVFASVCGRLSHTNTAYNFNYIPIHVLGSIYERFLGKVIVATDKRARVEEKPEVRKAGGVYYTPEYIVRYIVTETVGKLIEGKTPAEVADLRFADIACGSGSFLLGVFDELLRHHAAYYNRSQRTRGEGKRAGCIENPDGSLHLSLRQKRAILERNISGVDLDAQAVEVAQLSLFLKLLEEETTASARGHQLEFRETMLPDLRENIRHGNSLVGWDIAAGLFGDDEERRLYPMDFEQAFPEVMRRGGFDAIVGNPPYIRIQTLQETTPHSVEYFKKRYAAASKGNYDIYVVFIERALQLLNEGGRLGYIVPHKFFNAQYGAPIREVLSEGRHLSHVVHFGDTQVFESATTYTCLLFANKTQRDEMRFVRVKDINAWQAGMTSEEGVIASDLVTSEEWNFTVGNDASLFQKLGSMPTKLGDVAERIFQGIIPGADKVYALELLSADGLKARCYSRILEEKIFIEAELLRKIVSGSDVDRYILSESNMRVIYPYYDDGTLIDSKKLLSNYPLTFDYFQRTKKFLNQRDRGSAIGPEWYKYIRRQNIALQNLKKLAVPRLVRRLQCGYDSDGSYCLDNVDVGGITFPNSEHHSYLYFLGLLNSALLNFYFCRNAAPFRGGFFSANRQFIEKLPIRTIDFSDKADRDCHDRMVSVVEAMLAAKRQLQAARTDRDRGHYEAKCAALDRRIDSLVCELYGLTPEEIAVVEGRGA